uniref:hypothetical protein n=1 Tax=uncultured Draconibacterium sp. TaxID=1573823 RepID=UPI003216AFB4
MNYFDKHKLFNEFLSKWSKEFNQIPNIVKYISTYLKLANKFICHSINNTPKRIKNSQLEWVSLVSQFDHPLEKEFFKPYWVPLKSDSYDLFIDLSSKTFTLFQVHYFPFEPYQWYKKIWFEDMGEFLAWATDPTIDIESQLNENDLKSKRIVDDLFEKRDELGFAGKIDNREIENDDILVEDAETEVQINDDLVMVSGVTSMIVGLLPEDLKVKLDSFDYEKESEFKPKVTSIKSFVYFLHKLGFGVSQEYSLSLEPIETGYVKFENGVFTIQHQDKSILKDFIKKCEFIRNRKKPSEKPLYKYFCAGYPSGEVEFIPNAAKELGINIKIEYHGCIVRTLYSDEHGLTITDVQVKAAEIEEENKHAILFYNDSIGKDWLKKLRNRAIELFENRVDDGLPF